MNLGEIRSMARSITDLDVTDVSDSVLNAYILDGYNRFMALERRWPWLESSYTISVLNGVQTYLLSGIGDIREITAVVYSDNVNGRLAWEGHDAAVDEWYSRPSGIPRCWSKWSQDIYLWPIPDAAYILEARGYRNPTNWMTDDTTQVDADIPFHQALVYFAVACMYQLQEDLELAAYYRRSFDEAIMLARSEAMRIPNATPLILHGGRRSRRRWRPQIVAL